MALHEGADGLDGYLLWRATPGHGVVPDGTVVVRELVAASPWAYRALWAHALSIDRTRHVTVGSAAVDEPLLHLVDEPRALRSRVADALWLRILSVPAALQTRRYATGIDAVIEVRDADIPANQGRWHLVGDRNAASCTATRAPADLRLDVAALAATYLGGASPAALHAAGLVDEVRPRAVAALTAAMCWDRAPSAIEDF